MGLRTFRRARAAAPEGPPLVASKVQAGAGEVGEAHVAVEVEERAVELAEVAGADEGVLVGEEHGDQADAEGVPGAAAGGEVDGDEAEDGADVEAGAEAEGAADAEAHGDRVEAARAVERGVLQAVEDVEAGDPAGDGEHQPER